MEYYIYVVYDDESIYEAKITNKKDFDSIPKDKAYEAIKIFYDDKTYSHVIYGNDYVHLSYKSGCIVKAHWDEGNKKTIVIELKGVDNETEKVKSTRWLKKTFTGKLINETKYRQLRDICEAWRPVD